MRATIRRKSDGKIMGEAREGTHRNTLGRLFNRGRLLQGKSLVEVQVDMGFESPYDKWEREPKRLSPIMSMYSQYLKLPPQMVLEALEATYWGDGKPDDLSDLHEWGLEVVPFVSQTMASKAKVLRALSVKGPVTAKDLASAMDLSKMSVASHLRDLRAEGLVNADGERTPFVWSLA